MSAGLPPFRLIAQSLRDEITAGRISDQLPSENQLAEQHHTTRATVRKAIALLRAEGIVVSEQGKGAFVRPRPHVKLLLTGANYRVHRESDTANFNAEAAAQGHEAEQRLLVVEEVPAPADIAERLGIDVGATVIVRRRLFLVNGEPMQFCDGYYPAKLFRGTAIAQPKRIKGGVHVVIEERARLTRFVEDIDIRFPLHDEVVALRIPDGVPVARVLRTAIDENDDAVEVLESIVPTDRFTFRYVIDLP